MADVLNKPIGVEDNYAESWETVDHGKDQSVVSNGPLAGKTLHELATKLPQPLFGERLPDRIGFPLLFKFLDANQNLSVQVHPNDEQAARLDPPDLGKTEAWVILDAEPGARVYAGLQAGFDRTAFENALVEGHAEKCLHSFEPKPGDCIFIPAGVVHALGHGLLVAEIQQASDTTYRLFDWNRVGPDGKARELHIQQGLDAIDFQYGPVSPQTPVTVDRNRQRLVECDKFVLDRISSRSPVIVGGDNRFHIVAVIEGNTSASHNLLPSLLGKGQTFLLPAATDALTLTPSDSLTILDMYLP